jgi:AAA ATPase-like protein
VPGRGVKKLIGRKKIVEALVSLAGQGETVLVHGPRGIGKSAILAEVARKIRAAGKPCKVWPQTEAFGDVVLGLAEVYPDVQVVGRNHRQLRNAFRLAIEADPGVLILDHFTGTGTAMKGFLRHLRRSGLGILIAAEVDHPRDRARLRHMMLSPWEVPVPPLPPKHLRIAFDDALRDFALPHPLDEAGTIALLGMTRGRPGWIRSALERLSVPRYWSNGKVLVDLLEIDVTIEISESNP